MNITNNNTFNNPVGLGPEKGILYNEVMMPRTHPRVAVPIYDCLLFKASINEKMSKNPAIICIKDNKTVSISTFSPLNPTEFIKK